MPLEDFEFKREGNTLKAFDKATGELIDSGPISIKRMLIGGWLTTFCHTDERSRFVSVI